MRTYSHAISKWLPKMFVLLALAIRIQYVIPGNRTNKCANEFPLLCNRWCNLILKTYLELIYIKIVQRIHTQIVTSPRAQRCDVRALFFDCLFLWSLCGFWCRRCDNENSGFIYTKQKPFGKSRKKRRALSVDKTILNEMFYYTVFIVHGNVMTVSHGWIYRAPPLN